MANIKKLVRVTFAPEDLDKVEVEVQRGVVTLVMDTPVLRMTRLQALHLTDCLHAALDEAANSLEATNIFDALERIGVKKDPK